MEMIMRNMTVKMHNDEFRTTIIAYHRHPNDTCRSYAPDEMLSQPYSIIFSISIAITALVTLLLNIFVIITLMINDNSNKRKKHEFSKIHSRSFRTEYSNTHISFISLSISVIIYSSICVPGMYLQTIDDHNVSSFFVRLLIISFYVAPIASSFMHLLMAFDRYLAIKAVFSYKAYWYQRHYRLCVILLWMISFLITLPFFWYNEYSTSVKVTITFIRLLFTFTIPSLLTLVLYLSIACELVKVNCKQIGTNGHNVLLHKSNNLQAIRTNRKVIVKILVLAFTHFLCWFPFSVVESLNDLFPDLFHRCSTDTHMHIYYQLMAVLILMTSLSGVAYPILYCFVSKEFQKLFKCHLMTFCIFKYNSPQDESSSSNTYSTEKIELVNLTTSQ